MYRKTKQQKNGSPSTIFSKRKNTPLKNGAGFTLIEMLVAVGVFTVAAVIAAGALLSVVEANRKSQGQKSVINNLSFAVEGMVRQIRVGTTYHCGTSGSIDEWRNCAGTGDTYFAFEKTGGDPDESDDQIVYRYDAGSKAIERSLNGGGTWANVTAPEVVVDKLEFYVDGADPSDTEQPRVLILVEGHVGERVRTQTRFNIQTLVSQRLPDR